MSTIFLQALTPTLDKAKTSFNFADTTLHDLLARHLGKGTVKWTASESYKAIQDILAGDRVGEARDEAMGHLKIIEGGVWVKYSTVL